jgi:hypothetical protein
LINEGWCSALITVEKWNNEGWKPRGNVC